MYPDVFEKVIVFSVFHKIRVHAWRIWIVFARPLEKRKNNRNTIASYRACLMLIEYDVDINVVLENLRFHSSKRKRLTSVLKKSPLWRAFWKEENKSPFSSKNGYVWADGAWVSLCVWPNLRNISVLTDKLLNMMVKMLAARKMCERYV